MRLNKKFNIRTSHTLKRVTRAHKKIYNDHKCSTKPCVSPISPNNIWFNYNKNKAWEIDKFIDKESGKVIPVIHISEDARVGKSTWMEKDKFMCVPDGLKRSRSLVGYNTDTKRYQQIGQYLKPSYGSVTNTDAVLISHPNSKYRHTQNTYNGNRYLMNKQYEKRKKRQDGRNQTHKDFETAYREVGL